MCRAAARGPLPGDPSRFAMTIKNTLAWFYERVKTLAEEKRECGRTLEQYLRAMCALIRQEDRGMTYSILLEMYERSFDSEPCDFADAWMHLTDPPMITPERSGTKEVALETVAPF